MKKNVSFLILLLMCVLIIFLFFLRNQENQKMKNYFVEVTPTIEQTEIIEDFYPIAEFRQRITKKLFGVYISPQNSPIEPERFKGFHTGVDVEYEDVLEDVSVFAVCNGDIVLARWVSGYGGTIVLKCQINSINYYVIYGHLRASSITKNIKVSKGDQIAVLGKGNTQETDFERKHLHFGIHKNSMDLKGYVQDQNELNEWVNPLTANLFR